MIITHSTYVAGKLQLLFDCDGMECKMDEMQRGHLEHSLRPHLVSLYSISFVPLSCSHKTGQLDYYIMPDADDAYSEKPHLQHQSLLRIHDQSLSRCNSIGAGIKVFHPFNIPAAKALLIKDRIVGYTPKQSHWRSTIG